MVQPGPAVFLALQYAWPWPWLQRQVGGSCLLYTTGRSVTGGRAAETLQLQPGWGEERKDRNASLLHPRCKIYEESLLRPVPCNELFLFLQ